MHSKVDGLFLLLSAIINPHPLYQPNQPSEPSFYISSMNFLQKTLAKILGDSHEQATEVSIQTFHFQSLALGREVLIEVYLPSNYDSASTHRYPFVLFNDGQDLPRMKFAGILEHLFSEKKIPAILAIGIHCNERRIQEYGTARQADYKGRGNLAPQYTRFVLEELMPHLREKYRLSPRVRDAAYAGFSLGGLSAIDIAWAHPEVFGAAGVFSGALWWRSHDVIPEDPDADRIMHDLVQKASKVDKKQRFWFQCGTLDETDDRNHNGVIDAIDDTLDLIRDLQKKGIPEHNIRYLEMEGGRHEVGTWGEAMPDFLKWVFGK